MATSEHHKAHYNRQRAKAIKYLGGKCIDCGTDKKLEFDHRIASEKSYNVSRNLNIVWETLVLELDKCSLRCQTCHRQKTLREGETGGGWNKGTGDASIHGTATRYGLGCRCFPCRSASAISKGRPIPTKEFVAQTAGHGSGSMYSYHRCRCDICKEGHRIRHKKWRDSKK